MTREELNRKKQLIVDFMASKEYKPMSVKEMSAVLIVPPKQKKDLRKVINELSDEGKIEIDSQGKVAIIPENIKIGKYMGTRKGFGFVRVEGEENDIYISSKKSKGAFDGDTVRVSIGKKTQGRNKEGFVTEIVERGNSVIVGTYCENFGFGYVTADNQKLGRDIYIEKANSKGAISGHKVVVQITNYGSEYTDIEGCITEILGHINDPGVDILSIVKAYGLPEEYPEAVILLAESIEESVSEEEKQGRTDYRNLQTVTIDGEDAKDLDDAITLVKEGDIYKLGVHIADVSHYVTENSPLDKEALKRGTSVYLVDRVIPMIPHKLSNGICSLNEGVDRLALSCMMEINTSGVIVSHKIEETVIKVDRRMSYTSVNKIVELGDEGEREKYKEFIPMFELMYELADILRTQRFKKGSIDFNFPEGKIILDENGKPLEIKEYERTNAHRIIEEFMLAANQTVAEDYFWQEMPFLFRVHEEPESDKILQLSIFVNNFGYILKMNASDEVHPKEIQKLVNNVKGKPEEALISKLALRSMKQAKYSVSCDGHFGLAMKYYCHFTSPIRRYPDLQIHRIIKENLHGGLTDNRINHYKKILPDVAVATSKLERRADDSEREVEKLKKAEYMEQLVGQSFDGVISGVTAWGMYVELPNTVEGMVKVSSMSDDYYYFDEEHYSLVGETFNRTYKLGSTIRVVVDSVDKLLKTIDFVLAEDYEDILSDIDILQEISKRSEKKKKKKKKEKKKQKKKDKATETEEIKETENEIEKEQIMEQENEIEKEQEISADTESVAEDKKAVADTRIEKAKTEIVQKKMPEKRSNKQSVMLARNKKLKRKPSVKFSLKSLAELASKASIKIIPKFTGKVAIRNGRKVLIAPTVKRKRKVGSKLPWSKTVKPTVRKVPVSDRKHKGMRRIWQKRQEN